MADSLDEVNEWRGRLFAMTEEISMSPAEYEFYFPFVDNIYKIHGRSSNSKLASLSETMYFQCRIDIRSTQSKGKREQLTSPALDQDVNIITSDHDLHIANSSDDGIQIDPAVVASSDAFTASLLEDHVDIGLSSEHHSGERPNKRLRNRRPRETCHCDMKIKVVRMLDENWVPVKYIVTRTSKEGHSHDLALSDRIVKNHKVLELLNPEYPVEKKRLTAKEKRAFDVESLLQHINQKYAELEESMRQQYPNDKKRLDTTMRKWVNELQRTTDQFLATPMDSFFFA